MVNIDRAKLVCRLADEYDAAIAVLELGYLANELLGHECSYLHLNQSGLRPVWRNGGARH